MYLSRIELDIRRRETLSALAYPVVMHGAIEDSFHDRDERKLWRIDTLGEKTYLLLLSQSELNPDLLLRQFAPLQSSNPRNDYYVSKDYDPLLNRIANGQHYRFRLCANPVYCTKRGVKGDLTPKMKNNKERGNIKAHVTQDQQCLWLINKAEQCGFEVDKGESFVHTDSTGKETIYWTHPGFEIVHTIWKQFNKNTSDRSTEKQVKVRMATFEGVLTVTNAEVFREKLIHGIGHAKAYGCGLMTVIRI